MKRATLLIGFLMVTLLSGCLLDYEFTQSYRSGEDVDLLYADFTWNGFDWEGAKIRKVNGTEVSNFEQFLAALVMTALDQNNKHYPAECALNDASASRVRCTVYFDPRTFPVSDPAYWIEIGGIQNITTIVTVRGQERLTDTRYPLKTKRLYLSHATLFEGDENLAGSDAGKGVAGACGSGETQVTINGSLTGCVAEVKSGGGGCSLDPSAEAAGTSWLWLAFGFLPMIVLRRRILNGMEVL